MSCHATCIKENNPSNRKGPRNGLLGKKGIKFIPKQNTHDLVINVKTVKSLQFLKSVWSYGDQVFKISKNDRAHTEVKL